MMATPGPAGAPTEEENPRIALLRTCRRGTKLSVLPIFWGEEWAATCRVPRVYGTVMQRRDNGTKLRVNWSVDGETQTNDITELADPDFDVMVHDEPMRRHPSAARRRRAPDQAGVEDGETADEMEYSESEDGEEGDDEELEEELELGNAPDAAKSHDLEWSRKRWRTRARHASDCAHRRARRRQPWSTPARPQPPPTSSTAMPTHTPCPSATSMGARLTSCTVSSVDPRPQRTAQCARRRARHACPCTRPWTSAASVAPASRRFAASRPSARAAHPPRRRTTSARPLLSLPRLIRRPAGVFRHSQSQSYRLSLITDPIDRIGISVNIDCNGRILIAI